MLVVGNNASGYDIGREIALHHKKTGSSARVYQSIRHAFEIGIDPAEGPAWATHLETVPPLAYATEDEIVCADGRRLLVDTVLFATGYLYSFPYYRNADAPFNQYPLTITPPLPAQHTEPEAVRSSSDEYPDGGLQVHNLDAEYQTFFYPDPTLAIICLNKAVIPCTACVCVQDRSHTADDTFVALHLQSLLRRRRRMQLRAIGQAVHSHSVRLKMLRMLRKTLAFTYTGPQR